LSDGVVIFIDAAEGVSDLWLNKLIVWLSCAQNNFINCQNQAFIACLLANWIYWERKFVVKFCMWFDKLFLLCTDNVEHRAASKACRPGTTTSHDLSEQNRSPHAGT
jgi:hypothetical protein